MQLKVAAEYGPAAVAEVEAAEAEAAAARGEDVAQGGAAEQGACRRARCVRGVWGPLRARWGASRAETLHAARIYETCDASTATGCKGLRCCPFLRTAANRKARPAACVCCWQRAQTARVHGTTA